MMCRFLSIMLFLCIAARVANSNAEDTLASVDSIGAATSYMRGNDARQMLDKAFDLLIKAFQAGHPDAKARLCELRATSYDLGNIILVKRVEVHRYQNGYECDELVKRLPKASARAEQAFAAAEAARRMAAEKQEQERRAIAITQQKIATAIKERQERVAAEAARVAAEKLEQERLAVARAEEKLERERLAAAIAAEERAVAARAEQKRIAEAKAAQELQEKERSKQAQAAAEAARMAAVKQEQERVAAAEAAAKSAAAKAEQERIAAADAARERLAKERAKQVQAAAEAARLSAEKQEQERMAAVVKKVEKAEKTEVKKPEPEQVMQADTGRNSKPDTVQKQPKPDQQAPDLNLVSLSGMPVSLDQYRGSVLVIDFFAPWCQTCRRHIPKLAELHNKFRKQGLQVWGLNVDSTAGKQAVANFSDELRMTYLIAQADEAVQARFGVRSVPTVYVIDKKGRVAEAFRDVGSETGRTIESLVKKLLVEE